MTWAGPDAAASRRRRPAWAGTGPSGPRTCPSSAWRWCRRTTCRPRRPRRNGAAPALGTSRGGGVSHSLGEDDTMESYTSDPGGVNPPPPDDFRYPWTDDDLRSRGVRWMTADLEKLRRRDPE